MNISDALQQHRNLPWLAKKELAITYTLLMPHRQIHILHQLWSGNPMSSPYYFKLTRWTYRMASESHRTCFCSAFITLSPKGSTFLLHPLKIDVKLFKSVSSCSLPLEVLIRTPVSRVIIVSRGPLPHSWAAHFIAGSEERERTVYCLIFPPRATTWITSSTAGECMCGKLIERILVGIYCKCKD